jgi:hypothetical protein
MIRVLSAVLVGVLTACATPHPVDPMGLLPTSPLAPIQTATAWAVVAENQIEDPAEDATTWTALEAWHDTLLLPWSLIRAQAAIVGALAWTLADWPLHGYEPGIYGQRAQTILDAIPSGTAGPTAPAPVRQRR